MKALKKTAPVFVLSGLLIASQPAHAVFGVGDVSFDPTVYAQLLEMYDQGVQLYKTTKKQLDSLNEMQRTMTEAYQSYETLTNLDLNAIADDLRPGRYLSGASNAQRLGAARAELGRMESNASYYNGYVTSQLSRLKNLETLVKVRESTAKTLKASSTDQDVRKSSQSTAQSTATLAALAAAEAQRREEQEVAHAAAQTQQDDLLFGAAEAYRAMDTKKDAERP